MKNKDYGFVTEQDYRNVAGINWPSYAQFMSGKDIPESVYSAVDQQLKPPQQFKPLAFCVLPFYGIEYPSSTPCCLIKSNSDIEQIKLQMLQDVRPPACESCWNLEDNGLTSDREIKNATIDLYLDRNLEDLIEDCRQNNYSVVHYKIDTSNTCNATCVTCDSEASSAWAALEQKNQLPPKKYWKITASQTDTLINFDTAVSISFRGGEPLLSKTNFYILEQLLKHNNSDCFISFVTNGSVTLSDYQKDIISKFKNINFCLSIDGIGPVFEYLRYPLKWDQLLKNIEFCKNNNIMLSVSYTLSNLNIFYHEQTVAWFTQQNLRYLINPVFSPTYFQPSALPLKLKKIIGQANPSIRYMLDAHTDRDQQNYQLFRAEIAKQDQWKNIKMSDFLPEFAQQLERFPI
jgi:hypothetical protein